MKNFFYAVSAVLLFGCAHQPVTPPPAYHTCGQYDSQTQLDSFWKCELEHGNLTQEDYDFLVNGQLEAGQ